MLERLLRRMLWVIPSVLGVALLTFFALSFVPPDRMAQASPHARSHSLPLFLNGQPSDVRLAVTRTLDELLGAPIGSERAKLAEAELVRLGGSALPFILPRLDAYPPDQRTRVVLALAPLAHRMRLDDAQAAEDPNTALRFWTRFWEASEIEFRLATSRNAARRWAVYGDLGREREVFRLDTFALEALFELLAADVSGVAKDRAQRTIDAIAHVTERDDRILPRATEAEAAACVARWQHFWLGNRTSFVVLRGSERISAFALESRFGKWALEQLSGVARESEVRRNLPRRARITFTLVALAWLAALSLALPLGVWSALRRHSTGERLMSSTSWLALAAGPVVLGGLVVRALGPSMPHPFAAFAILVLIMVARPLHLTRARVTAVLASNAQPGGLARGASRSRIAWRLGLRDSIAPVLAGSLVECPSSLTACFVLERFFGIDGLGDATLDAVMHGDASGVMGIAVGLTCWAVFTMVLSDLALVLADPRTRGPLYNGGLRG